MGKTSLLQTRSQTTPPSCSSLHPLCAKMSFFDIDAECRDENEGSIITSLISQLRLASCVICSAFNRMLNNTCRVGMDLSKVTFPTFVLEPRSMLERITDFMSHPDLIFGYVLSLLMASNSENLIKIFTALTL